MTDPVQAGRSESLAHLGGNITGSFASRLELQAKRLEILKKALPGVTRVAVFLAEGNTGNQEWRTALERTARELGMELHPVEVHGPDDIDDAHEAPVVDVGLENRQRWDGVTLDGRWFLW